jgi:hypothetical protein
MKIKAKYRISLPMAKMALKKTASMPALHWPLILTKTGLPPSKLNMALTMLLAARH